MQSEGKCAQNEKKCEIVIVLITKIKAFNEQKETILAYVKELLLRMHLIIDFPLVTYE